MREGLAINQPALHDAREVAAKGADALDVALRGPRVPAALEVGSLVGVCKVALRRRSVGHGRRDEREDDARAERAVLRDIGDAVTGEPCRGLRLIYGCPQRGVHRPAARAASDLVRRRETCPEARARRSVLEKAAPGPLETLDDRHATSMARARAQRAKRRDGR